jgi:chorismate synthase
MVEAMVALTLVDQLMMHVSQCQLFPNEAPLELQPNPMGTTAHREGGPAKFDTESEKEPAGPVSQRVDEE